MAPFKFFMFLTGRLLRKFSEIGIQIFHVRFKIKYHPSIFEKYRLFNIAEHISKAQNKTEKYFLKIKGIFNT